MLRYVTSTSCYVMLRHVTSRYVTSVMLRYVTYCISVYMCTVLFCFFNRKQRIPLTTLTSKKSPTTNGLKKRCAFILCIYYCFYVFYRVVLCCVALHCATLCNVLCCIVLHCVVLHCTTLCNVLRCIVLYCVALRCVALCCVALCPMYCAACVALCYIVLRCVSLCCVALRRAALRCVALHCATLCGV